MAQKKLKIVLYKKNTDPLKMTFYKLKLPTIPRNI